MYVRLAQREEREVTNEFGETYLRYAAVTPRFLPGLRRRNWRDAMLRHWPGFENSLVAVVFRMSSFVLQLRMFTGI